MINVRKIPQIKFKTKVAKMPINVLRMIQDANIQRIKLGKDRKMMSIPKALEKISKHKFFPQILNEYTMEDFNEKQ